LGKKRIEVDVIPYWGIEQCSEMIKKMLFGSGQNLEDKISQEN